MSIQRMYRHTLVIKRNTPTAVPPLEDEYGKQIMVESTFATVPGLIQPRRAREVAMANQGGAVIGTHVGYLDVLAGLTTRDWMIANGIRYDIRSIEDAGGQGHHYELDLQQVT